MRGDPQAVSSRLLAVLPGRRWSSWSASVERKPRVTAEERKPRVTAEERKPRVTAEERIAAIERLAAEERAARRSGRYVAEAGYLGRRW